MVQGVLGFESVEVVVDRLFFHDEELEIFDQGVGCAVVSWLREEVQEVLDLAFGDIDDVLGFSDLRIYFL